jgi:hypothetical protein
MAVTAPSIPATATAVANPTGQNVAVSLLTGTVQSVMITAPNPPAVTTPAVPATTVNATNSNSFPCQVVIAANGSTISAVTVNGSGVGTAAGTYVVPAGGTIAISYTVATPTWTWTALVAGVSGNPIGSLPQNYPLPPGCSITLLYTSTAPTWSWSDPLDEDYTPGYYAPNTQAEASGWNPYTALPYAQHAALGQSGLATGVSN